MTVACKLVALRMPADLPAALDRHVAECLACQAEMVKNRRLARELTRLGSSMEKAPGWLSESVVAEIRESQPGGVETHSQALTRFIAASAMAATAGALAIVALKRRSAA